MSRSRYVASRGWPKSRTPETKNELKHLYCWELQTQSTEQTPGVVTKLQNMKQVTFHQQSTQVAWQVSGCRVALPRPLARASSGTQSGLIIDSSTLADPENGQLTQSELSFCCELDLQSESVDNVIRTLYELVGKTYDSLMGWLFIPRPKTKDF